MEREWEGEGKKERERRRDRERERNDFSQSPLRRALIPFVRAPHL